MPSTTTCTLSTSVSRETRPVWALRLMRGVSEKLLSRLGRGVPLAGGIVGGGIDGFMMKKIADHAMKEFPVSAASV